MLLRPAVDYGRMPSNIGRPNLFMPDDLCGWWLLLQSLTPKEFPPRVRLTASDLWLLEHPSPGLVLHGVYLAGTQCRTGAVKLRLAT